MRQSLINDYLLTYLLTYLLDEFVKFLGQKVKVQGHGGITYAGTVTAYVDAYSTRRLVSS